jgi:hypothetical protein
MDGNKSIGLKTFQTGVTIPEDINCVISFAAQNICYLVGNCNVDICFTAYPRSLFPRA